MNALSKSLLASVLLLAAVACDDGGDATAEPRTRPPAVTVGQSRCHNLTDAFERGEKLGGGLRGDVTGDGSDDDVYLLRDTEGDPGCTDLLFVESEDAILASELSDGRQYALVQPRLNALASIDDRPGAEIVVDLEQGASTQFVGLFTVVDADLERVRLPGDGGLGDLFPYGGSVGHIEASDCGEYGRVVVSVATPNRNEYEVQRSVYRFQGAQLQLDQQASENIRVAAQEVQELPEYRSPPFGSCAPS